MAEFCNCGSLIINDHCSNKNCTLKAASTKVSAGRASSSVKKAAKSPKTRKASKVVTYNLYDTESNEEEDTE